MSDKTAEEIIYNLKTGFEYAHSGEMRMATFITLKAPTVSNIGFVSKLKQGFMKAVTSQQLNTNAEEMSESKDAISTDDFSGEMIMTMLSMSDVDYSQYMQTAKAVFMDTGIALIDGERPLTKSLIIKLSVEDLEDMTGEYLKAFILTSALRTMQM